MNERIKELADRAFDTAAYPLDQQYRIEPNPAFCVRFAELIVRECIGCCEQVISDPVPKSIDTFEQGGIHCMDEIKQHFGVEE